MNRIPTRRVALLFGALLIAALWVLAGQLPRVLPVAPSAASQAEAPILPAAAVTMIATVEPIDLPVTPEPTTEATIDPYVLTLTAYPTFPDTPTPWPEGFEPQEGPTATITPTPSKVIDMTEGVPNEDVNVYIVRRADGSLEKYLIPITLFPSVESYEQVRDELLNLGAEDTILDSFALNPRPKIAPLSEEVSTPIPQ